MPVSSINAGIASGQSLQKGAMAQRAYQQEMPATTPVATGAVESKGEGSSVPTQEMVAVNVFSSAPIGSQTGIAAYVAIMNPPAATSMRIEA